MILSVTLSQLQRMTMNVLSTIPCYLDEDNDVGGNKLALHGELLIKVNLNTQTYLYFFIIHTACGPIFITLVQRIRFESQTYPKSTNCNEQDEEDTQSYGETEYAQIIEIDPFNSTIKVLRTLDFQGTHSYNVLYSMYSLIFTICCSIYFQSGAPSRRGDLLYGAPSYTAGCHGDAFYGPLTTSRT